MVNNIIKAAEAAMQKSIETLKNELSKMRSGRAHPSLLENLMVLHYGNAVPLKQVASITVSDARTLLVSPWEKNLVPEIEKAIREANLGLNPATAGQSIRVPLPALTEERRKDMVKLIKAEAENSRVSIRNLRRDANTKTKALLKDKKINEDEEQRSEKDIQKLTDKYIAEVDRLLAIKEKDLLEV